MFAWVAWLVGNCVLHSCGGCFPIEPRDEHVEICAEDGLLSRDIWRLILLEMLLVAKGDVFKMSDLPRS